MSNSFLPLFKTNLKIAFDFRGKKQNRSMMSLLIIITIVGMLGSALYGFIFSMAAKESNTPIIGVLYAMAGFASLLALTTTIPKVKTTLFGGNDYDMLAAMPIPKKEILFVKFFSLYLIELYYTFIILIPAGIVCFIFDNSIIYIIHSLVMLFLVPICPLLLACLIGTFISVVADRSKFGNIISTALYLVFIVIVFTTSMMTSSGNVESMQPLFDLFKWFNPTNVLLDINIPGINYLIYIVVNLVILIGVIGLLTFFYDYIHDLLSVARTSKKKTAKQDFKVNTSSKSLLKIDFKRYFSSKGYFMNTITGGILSVVMMGVAVFSILTDESAKETLDAFRPYLAFMSLGIVLMLGLTTPATSAISIEGKNMWIIKSSPIDYKKYLQSKILLSEIVMAPFALIASVLVMILTKDDVAALIATLLIPQLYLLSMNYISLVLNTRFYKLNWSNEMEVVKQSKCVVFAMLIDFAYTFVLAVLFISLGLIVGVWLGALVSVVFCLIVALIARHVLYKKGPQRIANIEV